MTRSKVVRRQMLVEGATSLLTSELEDDTSVEVISDSKRESIRELVATGETFADMSDAVRALSGQKERVKSKKQRDRESRRQELIPVSGCDLSDEQWIEVLSEMIAGS